MAMFHGRPRRVYSVKYKGDKYRRNIECYTEENDRFFLVCSKVLTVPG